MTDPQVAILMLSLFIVLVLLGFPIAFTLLAMGVAFGYYAYYQSAPESIADIFNNNIFYLLNQNTYSVMENDTLVAIPLFLFMGYVVERANIVDRLFFSLYMAARNLPGSLAIAALLTCAVFSTASGIVGAVVTLMGLLAYPAMANAGYQRSFASGVICAGGTLGILIPPSIMLIVYAAIAELSPLRLYAAAVFPGLLLAGLYIVYVMVRVWLNPSLAPKPQEDDIPPKRQIYMDLLVSFVPLTVLIMLVLGSILGGLATPAEAAAMGALGGLVLAMLYRSLTWDKVKQSVFLTAKATAMVCWLFVGSWTFASIFSYLGGHDVIEHWVVGMNLQPWQFLVLAQLIIFLLGWPLEWSEILIIFVPIFLPMLETFGVNPYFFAMLVALNLQTSFLTPPMAMSAYYLKGVLKNQIQLMEIFKGLMPYLAIVILCMVLMYQFPGIALWLPDYLFGVWVP
ncbi:MULTISPECIES: TRAP transporter large permease subunit [unclassified Ruegeria]|uniref:TRAP transporter large permease n=1 Tax=unclassified Ruegeria TaxID=2625375 RepID=UPI0014881C9A|nr:MULTISPECIES: TRAP transporter large permease subunit [unclassified Ruegeria]NOD76712.1 TRAP transporter large permease subunit [Ruegeria sp. HKCCD4332]NOD88183.1 TRAP transporter large permease subunit [Ruegeria sp. HKCCD4318]NOD95540.1 TRAP transporter large permease subunit [Ruegeria sp. HKCCD4884]NOE13092.1 TRAP transporter large permease subunit [Ruegeria sp. HKCCD4318-2]NOG11366.1 TRAP transporter large permease subunit [Ruegeria sp. HKCCD4315]